ncbi:MAG: MFS transporter [Woeseia sp.]|jgi:MFS family permease|nr:MFS transporter [Woeseia sp.]MBT6208727.1 MFS transporter [Woeseia sp.]
MNTKATTSAAPDDGSAYPEPRRAWGLVVVLTIAYAISFVDRQIISLMVEPIKAYLHLSDTQISLLMGPAFAVFYTIMGIPLGRVADKFNRRNLIVIGMTLWCLMTAASGLARNFAQLFVARMGIGVGEAALSPAALSMISDSFPPEKRTSPIGFYNSAIYIGSGLALVLGGVVIQIVTNSPPVNVPLVGELVPWQTTFIIVGLPGLIIAAIIGFMREPTRKDVIKSEDGDVAEVSMREVLAYVWKNRSIYGSIFIGMAVVAAVNFMFQGWIPTLYTRVHGWEASSIGYAFGVILLIFGPLGIFLGGRLGDYYSRQGDSGGHAKAAFLGSLFMVPGMIATPILPDPKIALAGLALIPFGMAFITVNIVSSMLRVTPNQMRGLAYALLLMAMSFTGMSLGPFLPALITDYVFANEMMVGYSMLIVSLSTAFISIFAFYKCIGAFRSAKL